MARSSPKPTDDEAPRGADEGPPGLELGGRRRIGREALDHIRRMGPSTAPEIARAIGASGSNVVKALWRFWTYGYLKRTIEVRSTRGRRPYRWSLTGYGLERTQTWSSEGDIA